MVYVVIVVLYSLSFGAIVTCVPLGESAKTLTEWGGGAEAEVLFKWGGVGVSDGHIAGLHGDELLVGFEIVVGWEHTCGDEFFLENGDEVQQILGRVVADVVNLVGRNRQTVFADLLFWRMLHDAHDALYNVINIGEVSFAVSIVENLDGLSFAQLVGEAEVRHVGTTGGAIDGEESQTSAWDVVELRIAMGK